jgi:hypothetical protein
MLFASKAPIRELNAASIVLPDWIFVVGIGFGVYYLAINAILLQAS